MRQVTFDPQTLEGADLVWWNAWQTSADDERAACRDAYVAGKPYEFVSRVWKDLKEFVLTRAFNNKCGYCESPMTVITYGDADHFRPKKKVTVKVNGKAQPVHCEGGEPHPGYHWLAYDWRNLIPACEKCNRANGKMNQFPVRRRHHCTSDLDSDGLDGVEEPLLLNPYRESSVGVLRFGDRGTVASVDGNDRGECSIGVYRLDREDLETERSRAQTHAWLEWTNALGGRDRATTDAIIAKWESGSEPYSLAALDYIRSMWKEFRPRMGGA